MMGHLASVEHERGVHNRRVARGRLPLDAGVTPLAGAVLRPEPLRDLEEDLRRASSAAGAGPSAAPAARARRGAGTFRPAMRAASEKVDRRACACDSPRANAGPHRDHPMCSGRYREHSHALSASRAHTLLPSRKSDRQRAGPPHAGTCPGVFTGLSVIRTPALSVLGTTRVATPWTGTLILHGKLSVLRPRRCVALPALSTGLTNCARATGTLIHPGPIRSGAPSFLERGPHAL